MWIRSTLGDVRRHTLRTLFRQPVELGDRGPIISFTFDDFPRTALTVGARILEDAGARGTYYVAFGLMGTTEDVGEQFRLEDIHSLMDRGHELGSHTFSHVSCRSKSLAEYCEEVRRGFDIVRKITGKNCGNFSYPFGDVTLKAKKALASEVRSCRSIIPGVNGKNVDLALLRANRLYGDRADQSELMIQDNLNRRGWLIFYTHDIRYNPSSYGCTPAMFEATVTAAVQSGSRILTIDQTLGELGVTQPSAGQFRSRPLLQQAYQ